MKGSKAVLTGTVKRNEERRPHRTGWYTEREGKQSANEARGVTQAATRGWQRGPANKRKAAALH